MSLDTNLAESISTFGPSDLVSEQLVTLSIGQLQDLIAQAVTRAVEKAIQPLQEEVAQLRHERDLDRQELASMRSRMASLESTQEEDVSRICLDIALDRQRLAKLEHPTKEPGKTETSRAEKIEKYLVSRPDHRATFETLKGHLGVDKFALNDAIRALMNSSPGRYGITRTPGDKRKRTLVMLPK